jgi:HSP20 family protein
MTESDDEKDCGDNLSDMFGDLFGDFDMMDRRFEKMFSDLSKLKDCDVKTYGYTMVRGPDGIPHVREFGNMADSNKMLGSGTSDIDEPLTDVSVDARDKVRATVELPGVAKENIELEVSGDSLKVSADTAQRNFEKTIALPRTVDPDSAVARLNNGILEVTMDSVERRPKGKMIQIQ